MNLIIYLEHHKFLRSCSLNPISQLYKGYVQYIHNKNLNQKYKMAWEMQAFENLLAYKCRIETQGKYEI